MGPSTITTDGLFVEVIDNYYEDPYSIRNFALSCEFDSPFTGTWNGLHSIEQHPGSRDVFFDLAKRIPEDGQPNWAGIEGGFRFWGRPSAGFFAVLLEGQQDTVHFHRRTGTWAGVCYLSLPHDSEGRRGVTFYRHRATGLTTSKGSSSEHVTTFRRDATDRERWEEIDTVDMVFNRMVVFDGRFFHAASDGFGTMPSNSRLTQLFNIDFVQKETKDLYD